jgi:hypothetical protein
MSDVLQRVRSANPFADLDDIDSTEFEMALAAIEDRWEFGDEPARIPAVRRPGWMRPTLIAAGAALLVILAITVPALFLRGEEQSVTDTTLPPATTTTEVVTTTLPVATTTPTTIPPPVPTAPAMNWQRVPDDPMFDQMAIWTVTAGGPGLVAAGGSIGDEGTVVDAIVWVSTDGFTWERIDDPSFAAMIPPEDITFGSPATGIRDVAANSSVIVAAGFRGNDATTWLSEDGIQWSQSDDEDLLGEGFSNILAVTEGGPGWVAVGDIDMDGGVWVSEDGLDWVRVDDDDLLAGDRIDVTIYDVTAWNGGLIAVGAVGIDGATGDRAGRGTIWISQDGIEWTELSDESLARPRVFGAVSVDPSTGRVFVFGSPGGFWSSMDGVTWEVADAESQGEPPPSSSVAWDGDRAIAGGPDMALSLWVTGNSGQHWTRVDPDDPAFEGYAPGAEDVALFEDQVIVVGHAGEYLAEVGAIWIGTWDE